VRTFVFVTFGVAALTVSLFAQAKPAVEGVGSGARVAEERLVKLTTEWTPVAPKDLASGPAPRLPDGKPDLSGPWVGGG
jgi:hypothetical protein